MSEVQTIDRATNIKNNTDAAGKKWEIFTDRQTGLAFTRPNPDRSDAVIPKLIEGRFTQTVLLQKAIDRYLELNWDEAELLQTKSTRKSEAAKENKPDVKALPAASAVVETPVGQPSAEEMIQAAVDAENEAIKAALDAENEGMATQG